MWYEHSYRRHLADMHIEDWDDAFLSEFDPDAYYQHLKTAGVDAAMIYLQSHVGLCYYPTKSGRMHRAFQGREGTMAELIAKCRENGIRVVAYYSLTHDNYAHDTYPAWRMVDESGVSRRRAPGEAPRNKISRYGLVCPNNPDYRSFTLSRIEEMASYTRVDGVFYDMPFWPHRCYCEHCRTRFLKETGMSLPRGDFDGSPAHVALLEKQREWMAELARLVADHTKRVMGDVSVEYNLAYAALPDYQRGMSMSLMRCSDYAGGDLYGTAYEQSFTCKYYDATTTHKPFEYMFSRCAPGLSRHTLTKSEDRTACAVMLTAAHHGATLVIDAIDPVGTLDARVYQRIGRAFAMQKPYEPYFKGKLRADVGLYYSFNSRYPANGNEYTNGKCVPRLARTFIENHVSHAVVGGEFGCFEDYRVVVAPCLTDEEGEGIDKLLDYVAKGGSLIFSDGRSPRLMQALLGTDKVTLSNSKRTYVAPAEGADILPDFNEKYPLPIDGFVPLLGEEPRGRVLARTVLPYTATDEERFASIHSNPPGIVTDCAAIVEGEYGKGRFIWLSHVPEFEAEHAHKALLLSLIDRMLPDRHFATDAPENVELLDFADGNVHYLSLVLLSDAEKAPRVPPFSVDMRVAGRVERIERLPMGEDIPFSQAGNRAVFSAPADFHMLDMIKIVCE